MNAKWWDRWFLTVVIIAILLVIGSLELTLSGR